MLKSFIKSTFIPTLKEEVELPDESVEDVTDTTPEDSSADRSKLLLGPYSERERTILTNTARSILKAAGLGNSLSNIFALSGDSPKRLAEVLSDAIFELRFTLTRNNIIPATAFKGVLQGKELTAEVELSLRRLLPMMTYVLFIYSDLIGRDTTDFNNPSYLYKTVKDSIYVSHITKYTKKMFSDILPLLDTEAILSKHDRISIIYHKLTTALTEGSHNIHNLLEAIKDSADIEFTGVTNPKNTPLEPAELLTHVTQVASSRFLAGLVVFYAITRKEDAQLIDEQLYVRAADPKTLLQKLSGGVSDSETSANIPQETVMGSEKAQESVQEQLINSLDGIVDDSSILRNECNPRNFILILAELISRYTKEGKITVTSLNIADTGLPNESKPIINQSLFTILQEHGTDSIEGLLSLETIKFLQFMFLMVLDPDGKPAIQSEDLAALLPGLFAKLNVDAVFDVTSDAILVVHKVKIAQALGIDVDISSKKQALKSIETQGAVEDDSFKARLLAYVSSNALLALHADSLSKLSNPKQIIDFALSIIPRLDTLNRLLAISSDKDAYASYIGSQSVQLSGNIVTNAVKVLLSTNEKNRVLSQLRLSDRMLDKAALTAMIKTGSAEQLNQLKHEITTWMFSSDGETANEVTFSQANKDKIVAQLDRLIAAKESPITESRDAKTMALQRHFMDKISRIILADFTVIGPEIKALVYFIKDSVTPLKELANGSPVTKYEVVSKEYIKAFRLSVLPDAIVKSFVDKFEYHKELAIESINSTQLAEDVFNDLQEVLLNPFEVAREVANWKAYLGILPDTLVKKLEAAEAGQTDIKELATKLAKSYINIAKEDRPKFKEALAKFHSGADKEWLPKLLTSYRKILADKFGTSRLGKAIEKIITKQYGTVQKLSATPYEELEF